MACKTHEDLSFTYDANASGNESMAFDDEGYDGPYDINEELEEIENPYNPSRTIYNDLVHTKLEVNFNWGKSRMNGKASITLKPHFYQTDSLTLDAKGMDILSVSMNGKNLSYTYDSTQIHVKLDKTYKKDESYTVLIDYVAKPDERETGGSMAISSDKGLYFINPKQEDKAKMPQIWTQGETEANSVWFPTIDSPNSKSTQEIFITVEDKYITLSNGKMIASKKNPDGTRTDHWKQDLTHAPYLFMMAVGKFKMVKDFYTRPDGSKMEVNYYIEPTKSDTTDKQIEQYAKGIFGETPAMIKYFSKLLGVEYPWDKYSQIVVRDYVSGAMENTGAVIFGDFVYKNDRELLDGNDQSTIAHELFHHWFGDYVTCESWANLPLNESFANYSQYLWDEHRYGLDEANYQAEEEAKGYYNSSNGGNHHNLINYNYFDKEDMFDGHSYNKGGRILHMLRNYLGDDAFFKGLNLYLTQNRYKAAEVHHLRLAFEEVCGEDLNWFFNQWFFGKGHPVLQVYQVNEKENSKVKLTVYQKQNLDECPLYKLPVDVLIHDSNGKRTQRITIDIEQQDFEFSYTGELRNVIFDVNQVLLGSVYIDKPIDQFLDQYQPSYSYKLRAQAIKYAKRKQDDKGQQIILDALKDPFWHIRELALDGVEKLSGSYLEKAKKLIEEIALNDPKSNVRKAALKCISKTFDESSQIKIYTDRIEKDRSYSVIVQALSKLTAVDKDQGLKKAGELIAKDKEEKILAAVAEVYGEHGTEENFAFFEKIFYENKFQGFDELNVVGALLNFCYNSNSKVIEKSYTIFDYLKREGNSITKTYFGQIAEYIFNIISQKMENETENLEEKAELERLLKVYEQLIEE
jgi:aminopeptidase N